MCCSTIGPLGPGYTFWNNGGLTYLPSGVGKRSERKKLRGALRCNSTCVDPVEGDQVWPPSVLSSVKTSKKLAIMKPPAVSGWMLVPPSEASVGLSRIITPFGKLPPEM